MEAKSKLKAKSKSLVGGGAKSKSLFGGWKLNQNHCLTSKPNFDLKYGNV